MNGEELWVWFYHLARSKLLATIHDCSFGEMKIGDKVAIIGGLDKKLGVLSFTLEPQR